LMTKHFSLLVGDNPFHGISHLSQERARGRECGLDEAGVERATNLVRLSLENGADGFMFSVDQTTLSIIKKLGAQKIEEANLYAIAPYAYEYVRKSTQAGGVAGLAKSLAKEMIFSTSNMKVLAQNASGLLRFDLSALLKTYVAYELSRLKSAAYGRLHLKSFMLHEVVTDMALALNMEKLFKSYIKFLESYKIRPGLETRNFPGLVEKFRQWNIDFSNLTFTSSFNKVGFQMCPNQTMCEEALENAKDAEVIAMSVLAAGYLKPQEAIDYLVNLQGLSGIVIGVSKEQQAIQTFRTFRGGNLTFLPVTQFSEVKA
jgi:hypothetical protein